MLKHTLSWRLCNCFVRICTRVTAFFITIELVYYLVLVRVGNATTAQEWCAQWQGIHAEGQQNKNKVRYQSHKGIASISTSCSASH